MIPNKALGQHFFTNEEIVKKIISLITNDLCETVIEIGPGKGAFTFELGSICKKVLTIEKDFPLYEYLKNTIAERKVPNIQVKNGDILMFNFSKEISEPLSVFGALPYNKSKEIIKNFLFLDNPRPKNLFFIVQKEVASKYLQKSPRNNYYSVITQLTSNPERLFEITPGSFTPRPNVDSTLVKFELKKINENAEKIRKFVRILYGKPRKTVKNNLKSFIQIKNASKIKELLNKRPSELDIDEIERLFLLYNK